jgi:hypothetical protein
VVSVSPAGRQASTSGPVTVTLDAVLPTVADHGTNTVVVDDRLTLTIGPRPFGPSRWADAGIITDFLPSVLPEGQLRRDGGAGRRQDGDGHRCSPHHGGRLARRVHRRA